jgi:hypothetical protein
MDTDGEGRGHLYLWAGACADERALSQVFWWEVGECWGFWVGFFLGLM